MTLVTGGTGQLGTAFKRLIPDAAYPGRDALDLSDPQGVAQFLERERPALIINCGAYTAVDRAESEEELASMVNGESVGVMARWAEAHDALFVTFSTDYVFDGVGTRPYVESDPTDPVNAYGRSKLAGELATVDAGGRSLIVRTSWVISGTHPNFVATMLRLARERELRVVDDQRGCPTVVDDLAAATLRAIEAEATGHLHLTNQGDTTWFELARTAVELAGIHGRIDPCPTSEYPTPATRPAYSVLGSERVEALGIEPLAHWRESLPGVVARLTA